MANRGRNRRTLHQVKDVAVLLNIDPEALRRRIGRGKTPVFEVIGRDGRILYNAIDLKIAQMGSDGILRGPLNGEKKVIARLVPLSTAAALVGLSSQAFYTHVYNMKLATYQLRTLSGRTKLHLVTEDTVRLMRKFGDDDFLVTAQETNSYQGAIGSILTPFK